MRAAVSDAFGCGLVWAFTFGLGEAVTRGSVEGSCHTVNSGLGFGFGFVFTGAVGELEAFAGLPLAVGLGPLVTVSGLDPLK